MSTYDHLIGRQVAATAKGFTFTGTLRHAQEVSVPGALEIVTPDGEVDFGGMPEVFDTIQATEPLDLDPIRARVQTWQEMHAYNPQEARDIDLLISEVDRLRAELMVVNGEKADLQRKVDTHECVPTQWAYDQACKALHEHRARADAAQAKVTAVGLVRRYTNEDGKDFVFVDDVLAALGHTL